MYYSHINEHKHETLILKVAVSEVGISKSPFVIRKNGSNVRCPILAICFWHQTSNRKACCRDLAEIQGLALWLTVANWRNPNLKEFSHFFFNWLVFLEAQNQHSFSEMFSLGFFGSLKIGDVPMRRCFSFQEFKKTHVSLDGNVWKCSCDGLL